MTDIEQLQSQIVSELYEIERIVRREQALSNVAAKFDNGILPDTAIAIFGEVYEALYVSTEANIKEVGAKVWEAIREFFNKIWKFILEIWERYQQRSGKLVGIWNDIRKKKGYNVEDINMDLMNLSSLYIKKHEFNRLHEIHTVLSDRYLSRLPRMLLDHIHLGGDPSDPSIGWKEQSQVDHDFELLAETLTSARVISRKTADARPSRSLVNIRTTSTESRMNPAISYPEVLIHYAESPNNAVELSDIAKDVAASLKTFASVLDQHRITVFREDMYQTSERSDGETVSVRQDGPSTTEGERRIRDRRLEPRVTITDDKITVVRDRVGSDERSSSTTTPGASRTVTTPGTSRTTTHTNPNRGIRQGTDQETVDAHELWTVGELDRAIRNASQINRNTKSYDSKQSKKDMELFAKAVENLKLEPTTVLNITKITNGIAQLSNVINTHMINEMFKLLLYLKTGSLVGADSERLKLARQLDMITPKK